MKKSLFVVALCLTGSTLLAVPKNYRIQKYSPYEPVDLVAKRLKTSQYSKFENPTGIYFNEGEEIVVKVGKLKGEEIQLRVFNFGPKTQDSYYKLTEGENRIKIKNSGLGYISYFTTNFKKAKKVEVAIEGGKINGVFNVATDSNEDWKKLLDQTVCPTVDLVGKYVHLAYTVDELKQYCPENGVCLVQQYDSLIQLQHELMGLVKYKERPDNRMFGRSMWNGFMHADGMGAAFNRKTLKGLADVNKVTKDSWGIAHEFGHVNQTRRGLKWVSTTEVTNNIFSAWTQYTFSPEFLRLEHEVTDGGEGSGRVAGGRFNAYLTHGIAKGENWLCQKGPDKMQGYENGGDHFVKLCPLWQLQLYYAAAGKGNKDFYADITHLTRQMDDKGMSNGELQLRFMKNACDVQKEDLTDFFEKAGMLKPIDRDLDDYTRGQLTITQEQCDELKRYASKYKKPKSPVIYYISGNSVAAYKKGLPVTGIKGEGISEHPKGGKVISHDAWKNVTVFECYKNAELLKVTMAGTGYRDNSATRLVLPEGTTRVVAVGWDGERKDVL